MIDISLIHEGNTAVKDLIAFGLSSNDPLLREKMIRIIILRERLKLSLNFTFGSVLRVYVSFLWFLCTVHKARKYFFHQK